MVENPDRNKDDTSLDDKEKSKKETKVKSETQQADTSITSTPTNEEEHEKTDNKITKKEAADIDNTTKVTGKENQDKQEGKLKSETQNESNELDIEEIGDQFKLEERPRGRVKSILITLLFVLGPVMLFFDLIFSFLFDSFSFDPTYIFGFLTALFVILAIIRAKNQASRYS